MSRIGKQPINLPETVAVSIIDHKVTVKANDKTLSLNVPPQLKVELKDKQLIVSVVESSRHSAAMHGLFRSLLNNLVIGVTQGFSKTLEIQGTGYRVAPKDKGIEFSLGYSHPIVFNPPEGIKLEIQENKFIVVSGADKYLVGQTAANIKKLRLPDAYKGKGIRYAGEKIKLKSGKAAKAAE